MVILSGSNSEIDIFKNKKMDLWYLNRNLSEYHSNVSFKFNEPVSLDYLSNFSYLWWRSGPKY